MDYVLILQEDNPTLNCDLLLLHIKVLMIISNTLCASVMKILSPRTLLQDPKYTALAKYDCQKQ